MGQAGLEAATVEPSQVGGLGPGHGDAGQAGHRRHQPVGGAIAGRTGADHDGVRRHDRDGLTVHLQVAGGALLGGLLTAAAVYLLAWQRGVQGFRLIIVGIAVSAMLTSFNTWLMLTANQEVALSAAVWGAGSLNGITWEQAVVGGVLVILLLIAASGLSPSLRQLELGDDAAKATGTRTEPVRLTVMLIAVALTAVVTNGVSILTLTGFVWLFHAMGML